MEWLRVQQGFSGKYSQSLQDQVVWMVMQLIVIFIVQGSSIAAWVFKIRSPLGLLFEEEVNPVLKL